MEEGKKLAEDREKAEKAKQAKEAAEKDKARVGRKDPKVDPKTRNGNVSLGWVHSLSFASLTRLHSEATTNSRLLGFSYTVRATGLCLFFHHVCGGRRYLARVALVYIMIVVLLINVYYLMLGRGACLLIVALRHLKRSEVGNMTADLQYIPTFVEFTLFSGRRLSFFYPKPPLSTVLLQ